jgi:uncharacterized protein YkwD
MGITLRHTLAGASAALVLATACAGAGGAGRRLGGGRLHPGAIVEGQLVPARPAADAYGGPPSGGCQGNAAIRNVMNELTVAARRAGRPPPELDPRVCAVAETLLAWDAEALGPPRAAVLSFLSSRFGLPAVVMPPTVGVLGPLPVDPSSEIANDQQVAERIVQAVGNSVVNAVHPRLGMAIQRTRKGKSDVVYKVSVAFVDAPVELDLLPRRLDPGQKATLSGRVVGGAKDPRVFVSDAVGQLSAPEQPAGEAFEAELSCGDHPGRMQVEIRAEYEGSSGPVASFPVLCGQPLPDRVAVAGTPWPTDPAAAEQRILGLVNEEREAAGLKPLVADPALASVARTISGDLAARGGAPGGPDLGERLKKEGIASPVVLQSAAAERTFERAHDRLMASPTNRANLMSAEVTNAGVGVVTRSDAENRPIVYVTEIFIRELPTADVEKTRQALRDAVARKRKDARTNALATNATLDAVAQKYAEALAAAGGTLAKEKGSKITSPLNKGFRTVTMISGAKPEPLDLAEEPQTTAPGKALGVGVAQGKHPVLGRNATYVVLMVGTPRR